MVNLQLIRASFFGIAVGSCFGTWQNNVAAGMTAGLVTYIVFIAWIRGD